MNIIDQSHDEYMRRCRREQAKIDRMPKPRITKKFIVNDIRAHYPEARCTIGPVTASGKGVVYVECNHGNCDRIGQMFLRSYPKQAYTYFISHAWRKGHVTLYFKR